MVSERMEAIHRRPHPSQGSTMITTVRPPRLLRRGTSLAAKSMLAACLVAGPLPADEPAVVEPKPPAAAPRPDAHPQLTRLSRTEDVWVDRDRKEVVVGGRIALDEGVIEVFACPERSKEHEAIVATRSSARTVHAALLAIGLEPGRPVSFDPAYTAARGPVVRVRVRWKDDAGGHERPAQELIRDTRTGEPLAADWVFAGSLFWRDPDDGTMHYQADGGDMICVSNFSTAMLDLPIESSQANDALMFEAFAGRVPPHGSEVELVLSAGD